MNQFLPAKIRPMRPPRVVEVPQDSRTDERAVLFYNMRRRTQATLQQISDITGLSCSRVQQLCRKGEKITDRRALYYSGQAEQRFTDRGRVKFA